MPVLPVAIDRRIRVAYATRDDRQIVAASSLHADTCAFSLSDVDRGPPGDWCNYLRAATRTAQSRWDLKHGIDATVTSDLPEAAGLSSSSALLTAFTLALLYANDYKPSLAELMDLLPDGEQLLGTRGGGMDHAAVLGSQAGSALLVHFEPLELTPIPIPSEWRFLVAHSLARAEKSTALRSEYNRRRQAGYNALRTLGLPTYSVAKERGAEWGSNHLEDEEERAAFVHVVSESERVDAAVTALYNWDLATFGNLMSQSHASLRDRVRVSTPALDTLVRLAIEAGASGARLTGAGFGGCVVVLCTESNVTRIRDHLFENYYLQHPGFHTQDHLFVITPSAGALIN